MHIFVRLLAKICAHFCAPFSQNMCTFVRFLKIFDVRIFVRLLAKICAHLSLELLNTLLFPEVKWKKNMLYVRIVLNVSFCKWSRCGCFTKILIFVTCKAVQNAFQRTWKQIPQVLCYIFLKVGNVFFVKLKY